MEIARFNDAAITMDLCLCAADINYAVIGGLAMTQLCEDRETKRIDCIAIASQSQVIHAVDHNVGLVVFTPKGRDDYLDLEWTDLDNENDPVPLRIFCSINSGSRSRPRFRPKYVRPKQREVIGETCGSGTVNFHTPVDLFKASLAAAGDRCSFSDFWDLKFLLERYDEEIAPQLGHIALVHIGRAIRQHRNLEYLFEELGVDVAKAKIAAKNFVPFKNPRGSDDDDAPKDLFDKLGDISPFD
ncbi:hypothetical protein POX_e06294 [Penicillium oxalicum]|uniref:hypothetical protein n=1 Tax=Penicillium oxalicum TaxID=69781 RepID=UPI0020B7637D|nr:hypothetical protein POX_e06294 [Penicillium oxalicum]KAI2788281.1 hypothetical protein POX_e06294 [Penicillium oxalicum]